MKMSSFIICFDFILDIRMQFKFIQYAFSIKIGSEMRKIKKIIHILIARLPTWYQIISMKRYSENPNFPPQPITINYPPKFQ